MSLLCEKMSPWVILCFMEKWRSVFQSRTLGLAPGPHGGHLPPPLASSSVMAASQSALQTGM